MAFNPVDMYDLASDIYAKGEKEVSYRSAISRAYYAAFLYARNKAQISSKVQDGHQRVANHYRDDKKTLVIANRLDDLRTKRTCCDYDCDKKVSKRDAEAGLALSRKILTDLGHSFPDVSTTEKQAT